MSELKECDQLREKISPRRSAAWVIGAFGMVEIVGRAGFIGSNLVHCLISNRDLIVELTWREVLSRYCGSVLALACSFINLRWGIVGIQFEPPYLTCIE